MNNGLSAPYELGWFVGEHHGHRFMQHTGDHVTGFGIVLTRFPDDQLTVIALTNQNGANPAELAREVASRCFSATIRGD